MKKLLIPGLAIGALATIVYSGSTSALSYQTGAGVSFTFNPTLTISISDDLTISSLIPGNSADSNIVTVGVATNTVNGYILQATAGTNSTNNRLVNTGDSNYYFSSLGTSDTVASMSNATDNTWGYSYSTDNGTTWISAPSTSGYSGLPQDANTTAAERGKGGKTLIDTNNPASSQSIKFKIGAKAATTQAAGTYTNTINFYAVGYPEQEPEVDLCASSQYVMQNVSTWGSSVTSGNEITVCDNRDGKTYTAARLDDGNIWMTQNLDFDIVNGGADLDSTNTDVPSNWADAGNLANTYATNDTTYEYYADQPESYDPGDFCWDDVIDTSYSGNLANNTTTCTSSNMHYHIGNYYNWTAAVAMADSSSYTTDDEDVDQSICPAGWMLPKSGSDTSSGSFAYLKNQASLTAGTSGNIHSSPNYFVYGGYWYGGSDYVGGYGLYWSSVVGGDGAAYGLSLDSDGWLDPRYDDTRANGALVRCVAR